MRDEKIEKLISSLRYNVERVTGRPISIVDNGESSVLTKDSCSGTILNSYVVNDLEKCIQELEDMPRALKSFYLHDALMALGFQAPKEPSHLYYYHSTYNILVPIEVTPQEFWGVVSSHFRYEGFEKLREKHKKIMSDAMKQLDIK